MFAHATSSTSPTATTIAKSGVSKRPRSDELPVAAGASVSGSLRRLGFDRATLSSICGCTVRSAAFACSRLCPGFRRTMICSHHEPSLAQPALLASNERLGGEGQHHVRHPADVGTEEPGRHHADDGERHALHGELSPDDVAGAGEALPPEAMTDDGDRTVRRGAAVVGGRDHPAAYGGDAEHVEEPAADVGAVHEVALAARRQVERLRRTTRTRRRTARSRVP